MSDREFLPEIDDEQAKTIDRNLALGTDFLRDVLHRPEIVDEIPSGSTLAFRTIFLPAFGLPDVRLTAFRPRRSRRWGVRVTGIGEFGSPPSTGRRRAGCIQSCRWSNTRPGPAPTRHSRPSSAPCRTPATRNSWPGSSAR